jgi:Domain of unknown function (DUF4194)
MQEPFSDFAPLALKLLQGVIYSDDVKTWNDLHHQEFKLKKYFAQIGLVFKFDQTEGYAYLSQPYDEKEKTPLPRLIRREPLSYEVTLLLVVLRELLDDFDAEIPVATRKCFVTHGQLKLRIQNFFKEKANQSKLLKDLDGYIAKVVKLGFLRKQSESETTSDPTQYELKRIIRAKMTVEDLEFIKNKLTNEYNQ